MNQIQQLINQMCPNGVEWKTVQNVILSLKTGLNPRDNFVLNAGDADCYYITGKEIQNNKIQVSDKTDLVSKDVVQLINKRAQLHSNVLLFASTGTGTVGRMAIVGEYNGKWNVSETLYIITPKNCILLRFLMYVLYSTVAVNQFAPKISKGSVPHLKVVDLLKTQIPIPPLAIQTRIVEILDHFTNLTANLTAELNLRRKQFEHYREKLLSLDGVEGVEWKKLGEVCEYSKKRIVASELNNDNYIGVENLLQNKMGKTQSECCPIVGSWTKFEVGDVLIGNIRPYLRKIWLADIIGGTNGDVLAIHIKDRAVLCSSYLYFILSSEDFFTYDTNHSKGSKMPRGDKKAVLDYLFPIPPLATQHSIVSILDKFTALIENIEQEIALRQKQYEYYREQLLSFERSTF